MIKPLYLKIGLWASVALFGLLSGNGMAAEPTPKLEPKYPFRVGWANEHLPWYQSKPGEFPPHHSDQSIGGELVQVDFIHRTGQFRMNKTGELMDFSMPPYGTVNYLNSDADLRDVPLGTFFLFFLNQAEDGQFTRLATMQDQFTMDAGHGFIYRLDEVKQDGAKLVVTKQKPEKEERDLGKSELLVTGSTRFWRGKEQVKISDLIVGDELLFNRTAAVGVEPGRCTDIWIGSESHKSATQTQRAKHAEFVKFRGLPGWIDAIEGNQLTVTLFSGDAANFEKTYLGDFKVDSEIRVNVANDELRTWNVPVDNERGKLLAIKKGPVDAYGTSGFQVKVSVNYMLEGFRKGRVVRIFGPGWQNKDMPYGESLMGYGFGGMRTEELKENLPKEYPLQFPYRTDYGNRHLEWYKLTADKTPPRFSEHLVFGELVRVDESNRGGAFRADRSGETCEFSLTDVKANLAVNTNTKVDNGPAYFKDVPASVRVLNAEGKLSDIPIGTRCRFSLYQDEKGAFTKATLITDEFSYLANSFLSYRVEALDLSANRLIVARQIPEVKDYNGDMQQPPDIGRSFLAVNEKTRFWKGEQQVGLSDLAVGDVLLINASGEVPENRSVCTEIWIGKETHQLVSERQAKKGVLPKP